MMDDFYKNGYNKIFWHSSAHILASALKAIYGDTIKLGIGPAIDNGFYYDIDFGNKTIDNMDFKKIENMCLKIARLDDEFVCENVPKKDAIEYFKNEGNEYKIELINNLVDGEITFYKNGNFVDLCKGPHIKKSGVIKSIKILNIAGAYWKGNEKNKQMTRIYAISFPNNEMLTEYLEKIEEAKLRDHQKIGKNLKLYTFSEKVGIGLPLWLPRGTVLRNILVDFLTKEQYKRGYEQVITPHIGNKELYVTSGHYEKYGNDSFQPIKTPNEEEYFLKPMNCPHHCEIFRSEMRSYRDLPLRLAEFGTVYRYEQHGELHGLARTRCFTQDDSHIFCRKEQVEDEIEKVIDLIQFVFKRLGFNNILARLSLSNRKDFSKYIGNVKDWNVAENAFRNIAKNKNLKIEEAEGEAAFYGPKIDFIVKDAIGRNWQLGTVQLDFQLPNRFNLSFKNEKNENECPVMIHRAPFGSLERIIAILLEHTIGDLPIWLAPDQAIILPISDKVYEYSEKIYKELLDNEIRAVINMKNENLNKKIRDAELMKIPYLIIIGKKEIENNNLCVRKHGSKNIENLMIEELIETLKKQHTSNNTKTVHSKNFVHSKGFEPLSADPKSDILSS